MELLRKNDTALQLVCECGGTAFRIEFRKSESVQRYEEAGGKGHAPDTQVAVCTICTAEIYVVETEAKMPVVGLTEEVQAMLIISAAKRATGQPYRFGRHHRADPREHNIYEQVDLRQEAERVVAEQQAATWFGTKIHEDIENAVREDVGWTPGWPPQSSED